MSRSIVEQVADAVLYEGYMLYPYRPSSVKNRQRWTFGGVYPRAYSEAQSGSDNWEMRTECLVEGRADNLLDVRVRFLHLLERITGGPAAWQEASERTMAVEALSPDELAEKGRLVEFAYPAERKEDAERGMVLSQQALQGEMAVSAVRLSDALFRLVVVIRNTTPFNLSDESVREKALAHTLISTHTILHVRGGAFVSLTDPDPGWKHQAEACRNVGTWPVLVGEEGCRDTLLSSPIILPDYPQIAPESPGDLFDATEIDEILTLRILTLTEEEKREMVAADERARALLERTEALGGDELLRLHGVMRSLRPSQQNLREES